MAQKQFAELIDIIKQARYQAIKAVNTELINLYWQVGEYISRRISSAEWGDAVVSQLADYLQKNEPELKGFSDKNLWRMKQFYETYHDFPKLSALLREISWTNNLTIMSRAKSMEEREFYLRLCIREKYSKRELERQISSGVFERVMISNQKLSPLVREMHKDISHTFKDSYIFEFLHLPEQHSEHELQKGLIRQMIV